MRILFKETPYNYFLLADMSKVMIQSYTYAAAVGYDKKTGQVKLFLSEPYLEYLSVGDLAIVLEHEADHVHWRHIFQKSVFSSDEKNRAEDYIINDTIIPLRDNYASLMQRGELVRAKLKADAEKLQSGTLSKKKAEALQKEMFAYKVRNLTSVICLAPQLKDIPELKGRIIREMDSYTLAAILSKNEKENGRKNTGENHDQHNGGSPSGEGQGDSNDNGGESQPEDGLGHEVPQNVIDGMLQKAADKLANTREGAAGNIPSHVEMRLRELKKSVYDFKRHCQMFAQRVLTQVKERTWSRLNRRYGSQTQGYNQKQAAYVVTWIDTSGSMFTESIFKEIAGHLKGLSQVFPNIDVLFGDTQIEFKVEIRNGYFDLNKMLFKGGGGTSPQFVYDYAKEKRADGVMLFTDGCVNSFDTYGIKSFVALVGSPIQEIPGMMNVEMKTSA